MKKFLLAITLSLTTMLSTFAATIDDICGVYEEHTTGQQALSFLCQEYKAVDITNLVIVSKNAAGKLEFFGFYKSPNAVKGTFDEAAQTITFGAQKYGGSDSYYSFCKAAKVTATVAADGVITIDNWTISAGSDLWSKEMVTTLTPLKTQYVVEGTVSAPGYYEGNATLTSYGSHYLLCEGSEKGFNNYFIVNGDGNVVFPWATVFYSTDDYCYLYNTLVSDDLLMLGNASKKSSFKADDSGIVMTTPFMYYEDFSDEQKDNPTPNAQGTYTATFKAASSIYAPASEHGKEVIYNLQGQRIAQAQRGLNIINGSKVMVK